MSQCCKLPCQSPGSTWFQAQETPKLVLLRQGKCCWKKEWLFHEGGKKEKHLDRMPSLLTTLFLQAEKLDVPTHPGCKAREHDMGRWTKGRSWSDSCQDLREDEALHFGWKHECLRQDMMVLNLFNAPTWLTSLVDSTFKNTSHLQVSMVEKKPQNIPSPSLFP